jgi:hypothetical protein
MFAVSSSRHKNALLARERFRMAATEQCRRHNHLSSVEEDGRASELNAGDENLGQLVVACGDGPEMLELVEETLNEIAFAVEGEIARARGCSIGFGWDDWRGAPCRLRRGHLPLGSHGMGCVAP